MQSAKRIEKRAGIPQLRHGDQLSVAEFRRRYEAMPEITKAELINGVVYICPPVPMESHGLPRANLTCWLGIFKANTPGTQAGNHVSVRDLVGEQEPQPDLCLRIRTELGGQTKIDHQGYLKGAPELLGEIFAETVSYDIQEKFEVYERNGVLEFIVWRVEDEEIDWFYLKKGKFQRLPKTSGLFKSRAFPGLWLDAAAMIVDDMAKVIEVIQQGIASPEHRRFVAKLQSRKK